MSPRSSRAELVLEQIAPLATEIYRILEAATHEALDYFANRNEGVDGWFFSSHVRYRMKVALNRCGYSAQNEEDSDGSEGGALVKWRLDGSEVNTRYLPNNGLLLEYKAFQIRIWKRHRRTLSSCPSGIGEFNEQLLLDFGAESFEPRTLLIVWDVDSQYQLLRLELIKPRHYGQGPLTIEWSIQVPHPAEMISGEAVMHEYMHHSELPVVPVKKCKDKIVK